MWCGVCVRVCDVCVFVGVYICKGICITDFTAIYVRYLPPFPVGHTHHTILSDTAEWFCIVS